MKLEAGKYYVLASGQVVGPLFVDSLGAYMSNDTVDGSPPIWKEDGSADFFVWTDNVPKHNIVKEADFFSWFDNDPEHNIVKKFDEWL